MLFGCTKGQIHQRKVTSTGVTLKGLKWTPQILYITSPKYAMTHNSTVHLWHPAKIPVPNLTYLQPPVLILFSDFLKLLLNFTSQMSTRKRKVFFPLPARACLQHNSFNLLQTFRYKLTPWTPSSSPTSELACCEQEQICRRSVNTGAISAQDSCVFAEVNDYDELFKYMPRPLLPLDKKWWHGFASYVNNEQQMATMNHFNNVVMLLNAIRAIFTILDTWIITLLY